MRVPVIRRNKVSECVDRVCRSMLIQKKASRARYHFSFISRRRFPLIDDCERVAVSHCFTNIHTHTCKLLFIYKIENSKQVHRLMRRTKTLRQVSVQEYARGCVSTVILLYAIKEWSQSYACAVTCKSQCERGEEEDEPRTWTAGNAGLLHSLSNDRSALWAQRCTMFASSSPPGRPPTNLSLTLSFSLAHPRDANALFLPFRRSAANSYENRPTRRWGNLLISHLWVLRIAIDVHPPSLSLSNNRSYTSRLLRTTITQCDVSRCKR